MKVGAEQAAAGDAANYTARLSAGVRHKGMSRRVERPGVREGYDRWSETYDATPNPLVALDRRVTLGALNPRADEWVLDAGCGTGAHLAALARARSRAVGLDFSRGMLRVAQRAPPTRGWPKPT